MASTTDKMEAAVGALCVANRLISSRLTSTTVETLKASRFTEIKVASDRAQNVFNIFNISIVFRN